MSNLSQAIERSKKRLIKKAKAKGLWENFGQDELHKLKEKFDYFSLKYGSPEQRKQASQIQAFDNWCMNFDLSDLKQASHV